MLKVCIFQWEQQLTCCGLQKLSKVAAPDPFQSTSDGVKDGSRKIGEKKLIGRPSVGGSSSSKSRYQVCAICEWSFRWY